MIHMSKLFRNVPCLTHERMSPLLFVVLFPWLEVRDAGRPERSGGRPESRTSNRTARPLALIPLQYFRPKPTPSRRHGWLNAGVCPSGFLFSARTGGVPGDFRIVPAGSVRHLRALP